MTPPLDASEIPTPLVALCQRIQARGYEALLVGGGVRDLILGRAVSDWDVATSARPREVQALFSKTIPTGIKHGTVTVLLKSGLAVEVTTYRGEGAYSDGRHPDTVTFVSSLQEDLSRRDFTINAMAYDPVAGVLADPMGGVEDLQRRLVRAVGEAHQRFTEDGLRPLRAIRFAAVLQFALEERTEAAIPPAIPRFRLVSHERVRDELLKMLTAPRPSGGLDLMRRTGLMAEVLPELAACEGLPLGKGRRGDVLGHLIAACDHAPPQPIVRLAALLHDVGKPEVAVVPEEEEHDPAYPGHQEAGARRAEAVARRLRLSNSDRQHLVLLVREHTLRLQGQRDADLRRLLQRVGQGCVEDLFAVRRADLIAQSEAADRSPKPALERLEALYYRLQRVIADCPALSTRDLAIRGQDLMTHLKLAPGPRLGQLLSALLEEVIEHPALNTPEALLARARELMAQS